MLVMRDRVLITQIEPESKTSSGIMIASDESPKATVVQVGTGRIGEDGLVIPVTVQAGDCVLYNPNTAISVTVGGEKMLVVKEDDLVAVWEI